MKKKSNAKLLSSLTTFAVGMLGGWNMIHYGSARPGWLMLIASAIGFVIFLVLLVHQTINNKKETAA